jgi:hypothetical protein
VDPATVTWSLEPPDATAGVVAPDGTYTAPVLPPERVTTVTASSPQGDARHVFRVALVRVQVSPAVAGVRVGESVQLSAQVTADPAGDPALAGLEWLVEDVPGGNGAVGTVDASGRYTAPQALPQPNPVRVVARSLVLPRVEAAAEVSVYPGGTPDLVVHPDPGVVAEGSKVRFRVLALGGAAPEVAWYINDVEGGSAATGFVEPDGRWRAPARAEDAPATLRVEARVTGGGSRTAHVDMVVAGLRLAPGVLSGDTPGTRLTFVATAHFSDGRTEAVTNLVTTTILAPNPRIASAGAGAEVVLGPGAGETLVRVTDGRFTYPPAALLRVVNQPRFTLEVQPQFISVVAGSAHDVEVRLVPDRGPGVAAPANVATSPTVEFQAVGGAGAVVLAGQPPPPHAEVVAWVEQGTGRVVFGSLPGTAEFSVRETLSGATAAFSARLVRPLVTVQTFVESDTEVPAGSAAEVVPTLGDDVEGNGWVGLTVRVTDGTGQLTPGELAAMLGEVAVSFQDPEGTFHAIPELRAPGCEERIGRRHAEPWVRALGLPEPFAQGAVSAPLLYYDGVNPCASLGNPATFLVAETWYRPDTPGPHAVRVVIPGLASGEVPDQVHQVEVRGEYPQLALQPVGGLAGPRPHTARFAVHKPGGGPAPAGFHSFGFSLRITRPDGSLVPPDDMLVLAEWDTHVRFSVLLDMVGQHRVALESATYPADRLPAELTYTVVADDFNGDGWSVLSVERPSLRTLAGQGVGTMRFTLQEITGVPEFGNTDCLAVRPEQPERGVSRLEFDNTFGTREDGGRSIRYAIANDPTLGEIRWTLMDGQVRTTSWGHVHWAPDPGGTALSVRVEILTPSVFIDEGLPLLPTQQLSAYRYRDACTDETRYPGGGRMVSAMAAPLLEVSALPSVVLLPAEGAEDAIFTVRVSGDGAVLSGLPQPSDFRVLDADTREARPGLSVTAVRQAGSRRVDLELRAQRQSLDALKGNHILAGRVGTMDLLHRFTTGTVRVERVDGTPGLPLLALNARPAAGRPVGTEPFVVRGYLPEGAHGPVFVRLRARSPVDQPGRPLVGFGREDQRSSHEAGVRTRVTCATVVTLFQGTTAATRRTALVGDVTDEGSLLPGVPADLPDFLPDRTSATRDDVTLELVQDFGLGAAPVANTTAFRFEARRVGEPRGQAPDPATLVSVDQARQSYHWEELSAPPGSACAPLHRAAVDDPARDLHLHVDGALGDVGIGMLDMPFVTFDGVPVERDGRVRAFGGEAPLGRPGTPSPTPSGQTPPETFGVELDGVCFDPGFGSDEQPNLDALFSFANVGGYQVPRRASGLVPSIGGTSGGTWRPDGRYTVLARTPGVDFPGLDCGFLATGRAYDLTVDDYEDAAIELTVSSPNLTGDWHPAPRRVFTFGDQREGKGHVLSGVQQRGPRTAFTITTRPAAADGSPLFTGVLRADLVIGEWPPVLSDDEGIFLTARVDAASEAYAEAVRWGVPALVAAITGASGAWLEGGGLLAGAALGTLVAVGFTGVDRALTLGLSTSEGALAGSTAGRVVGKTAERLARLLKYVVRSTQGVAQTVSRNVVQRAVFNSTEVAGSASFGQDVAGGIIATHIAEGLVDFIMRGSAVGGAGGLVFDQLWVSIPEAATDPYGDRDAVRAFSVGNLVTASLSGSQGDDQPGSQTVPGEDESRAYLALHKATAKPLVLHVRGGGVTEARGATTCGSSGDTTVPTVGFSLRVGGQNPTAIPYVRTSLAGALRSSEEATARVRIDHDGSPVSMHLLDAVKQ